MTDKKVEEVARKHALLNAVEHEGKASVKAVVAKVFAELPEVRNKAREVVELVNKIVEEINSLSIDKQKELLKSFGIEKKKKTEERKDLPDLPDAKRGKVVTAFPPEPSKYPHLGHAKAAFLNHYYARRYDGKFILRFEDSNPEKTKEEYYQAFFSGLKWLGLEWDEVDYLSDHIDEFYEIVEKLIEEGKAYVCTCPVEKIRENRRKGLECEHRNQPIEVNKELWRKMLNGEIKEGEGVVRLKIDMRHKNTTMRDPTIMRPNHKKHARVGTKYKVWPTYDFATALLDAWEGVTHRIRSKEFELRTELQNYIREVCGYKNHPTIIEIARFELEGAITSGRKIREMISKGELRGWDDPRLVTLAALRRRGFLPEAIKQFLIETGVSKSESKITWDVLESINRKLIDPLAKRYFAVFEPVRIEIIGAPDVKFTKAPVHPDKKEEHRTIPVNLKAVYVERQDFEKFEGKVVRLKDLFNVELGEKAVYKGNELVKEMPKIHWVSEPNVKIKVVMPDGKEVTALAEPDVKKVNVDEFVQFERRGFCRVDDSKNLVFYYTHK